MYINSSNPVKLSTSVFNHQSLVKKKFVNIIVSVALLGMKIGTASLLHLTFFDL